MGQLSSWFANLVDHGAMARGTPPQTLAAFMRWCLAGSRWVVVGGIVANAVVGLTEVAITVLLGVIADAAIDSGGLSGGFWQAHWRLVAAWLGLLFVGRPFAMGIASIFQSLIIGPGLFKLVMSRLHRHTLGQAVTFFDNDFAGRIAQKEMQTAQALVQIVIETMNALSFAAASVIGTLLVASVINPWLGIVMAVWTVLYAAFMRYFLPRIRRLSADRAAARAMVTGQVVDTITNIKTVKLFASSSFEDRAAIDSLSDFWARAVEWGSEAVRFRLGLTTLAGALPGLMVTMSFYFVASGEASVGELATVGAISIRLSQMSGWVSWTLLNIYGYVGEVEDGMQTLAPGHMLVDAPNAPGLSGPPVVEFDDVTFTYGTGAGGVVGLSLAVAEGEKLGIVGASGAGKSTLVSLLLRLYDVEQGAVRIGGQDIRLVTQESVRRQVSMVTQETAMFNRSARDNIGYGRPGSTDGELTAAARRARADEFIDELQDYKGRTGYDAHLGERGVKLSGGQRQRIALARAILKDAPILVLDEATSALDSEVESKIQSALAEVMEGKTVLAVAHRLSTIAHMDRIIVLDEGRIVEEGTHDDLLARDGTYAGFWNRQSGGFIE